MKPRRVRSTAIATVLILAGLLSERAAAQPNEIFIPVLVYRTGPYSPSGVPVANGRVDYLTLVNARDGGINGVKIAWEECETGTTHRRASSVTTVYAARERRRFGPSAPR